MGRSIGTQQVANVSDLLAQGGHPLPEVIVSGPGPEFTSGAMDRWAERCAVKLSSIEPGKLGQNCFVESFNGKFRDECLNGHLFWILADARQKFEVWRHDYNQHRPHRSLGQRTPTEFLEEYENRLTERTETLRL